MIKGGKTFIREKLAKSTIKRIYFILSTKNMASFTAMDVQSFCTKQF